MSLSFKEYSTRHHSVHKIVSCGLSDDEEKNSKVLVSSIDGKLHICYRKDITNNLEDIFQGRFSLHQKAYQHDVCKIIEQMILDGLCEANNHIKVSGTVLQELTLATAYKDISAFVKLTDSVFEQILNSSDEKLALARKIYKDILCRKLYKLLGYGNDPTAERKEIIEGLNKNIVLTQTKIDYGTGMKNPLNFAGFYDKNSEEVYYQQFPSPKMENKCLILLRPSYIWNDTMRSFDTKETDDNATKTIISALCAISKENGIDITSG